MAEVTASKVMELRGRTGLGMMECKKALTETDGDMAKAEDLLRIKSGAKASKAADRVASEGVIGAIRRPRRQGRRDGRAQLRDRFCFANEEFLAFATRRRARNRQASVPIVAALATTKLDGGRRSKIGASGAGTEDRREHVDPSIRHRHDAGRQDRAVPARRAHRRDRRRRGRRRDDWPRIWRCTWRRASRVRAVRFARPGVRPSIDRQGTRDYGARLRNRASHRTSSRKWLKARINKFLAEVTLLAQPFVKGDGKQTVEQLAKAHRANDQEFHALCRRRRHRKKKG